MANVFPHKGKFISIKIGKTEQIKIQNLVLRLLKLKDLNQLRDRFEGVRFHTQFSRKVRGIVAIEKVLGVKIMNWDIRGIKDLSNNYQIGDRSFVIETIEYGQWPIIIPKKFETLILSIAKGEDTIWVVGSATLDAIKNDVRAVTKISPIVDSNHLVELSDISNFSKFNSPSELLINS
ncbi:hypothetical protein BH09BAC3_BH09BAC3_29930 [soil metagenome]